LEAGGAVLAISQFTLLGDARRGRRPAFDEAAPPAVARLAYDAVVAGASEAGVPVATGVFQANMALTLTNDGPVHDLARQPTEPFDRSKEHPWDDT